MVAYPHLPSNGRKAKDAGNEKIDQVYIGSCTNGRIEDLRIAASILDGRKIADDIRCIVVPASTAIWRQAMAEGLFNIFTEANCVVSSPPAGRASAAGWVCLLPVRNASRLPTVTLSGAWVRLKAKSIWRVRPQRRPPRSPAVSPIRGRSCDERQSPCI